MANTKHVAPLRKAKNVREAVGINGEIQVIEDLSRLLPDNYFLLNQIYAPNQRSRTNSTEIDIIVVGPTGIFSIEVKNHRGQLEIHKTAEWTVKKSARHTNAIYSTSMRNPFRQAKIQALTLGKWLREKGLKAWVEPLVVIPNPEAEIIIKDKPEVQLFRTTDLLAGHILASESKFKNYHLAAERIATLPRTLTLPPAAIKPTYVKSSSAIIHPKIAVTDTHMNTNIHASQILSNHPRTANSTFKKLLHKVLVPSLILSATSIYAINHAYFATALLAITIIAMRKQHQKKTPCHSSFLHIPAKKTKRRPMATMKRPR